MLYPDPRMVLARPKCQPRPVRQSRLVKYTEADYTRALELLAQMDFVAYARYRLANPTESLPTYQAVQGRAMRVKAFGDRLYAVRPRWEARNGSLTRNALQEAEKCIPRYLDRQDREDIKHDIVAAVLAGELAIEEIRGDAAWFKNEHFRGSIDLSRVESLDAPLFDDSPTALIDRLTTDTTSHC
jgi:hypothetical protein